MTKQIATGVINHYWKFFPLVCKIFYELRERNFNNNLDVSHYLHIIALYNLYYLPTDIDFPSKLCVTDV